MNKIRSLVAALACLTSVVASAQWQWIDKNGRKVYSDRPPPAEISERNIIRQPGGRPAAAQPAAGTEPAQTAGQNSPGTLRISGKDSELEAKKKKAESADAGKKKAEDEKQAAARAESCSRARRGKATLDSGMRVARMNDAGEREVMDDATRDAESKRMQAIIDADCK